MAEYINTHLTGIAFGSVMLASSAMNNLFVTYYLDLFMNLVKLQPFWFFLGQTVFMVWNAINDPLFGWISDTFGRHRGRDQSGFFSLGSGSSRRLKLIKYGGLLWAGAFMLVWLPPDYSNDQSENSTGFMSGVHFMVSLCFYDGMLTLVEVNHSALLVEITSSGSERAKYNAYSAALAGLGSLSSLVGHASWSRDSLAYFRFTCLGVALLSSAIFYCSYAILQRKRDLHSADSNLNNHSHSNTSGDADYGASASLLSDSGKDKVDHMSKPETQTNRMYSKETIGVYEFLLQITKHHNLTVFMLVYFVQGFDCTFEKNHFGIFLEGLVGDEYSKKFLGGIITASFIIPWIVTIMITPLIQKRGIYSVVKWVFVSRVVFCSLSMLLSSPNSPAFTCSFLLINRIMSETVCRLCPLVISDIVDEDYYVNKRERPMSATIIGASTLLGKGSQSLAPMLGYSLFSQQFRDTLNLAANQETDELNSSKVLMSRALVFIPLLCVLVQTFMWSSHYNLHGAYLKKVKNYVAKRDYDSAV